MRNKIGHLSRREMIELAGLAAAGCIVGCADGASPKPVSFFDGNSLQGWFQIENNATALGGNGIDDTAAFIGALTNGSDPVSAYLRDQLSDSVITNLAAYSPPIRTRRP